MTGPESYQKRRAYFTEYGRRNRAKRRENQRRWAAANREHVNAYARTWQTEKRKARGVQPRAPRAKPAAPRKSIVVTGETLRERFLSYRRATKA